MNKLNKSQKVMMALTGVAVAGAAASIATSYYITKKLVSIALDRKAPKVVEKTKGKIVGSLAMEAQELLEKQATAAALLQANENIETVEINATDGTPLVGHFYTCPDPKRTLIAMHGWRTSWLDDFGIIAPFWFDNNCNVLFVEQRGQNNSGGDYMGFGLTERFDALSWAEWINENIEGVAELPLYLVGISMGGATVLMASDLPMPENLCGIASDCAYTSPKEIWQHVVRKNLKMTYGGIRHYVINDMLQDKINVASDFSCPEALKNCTVPVLFIHGTDDHFVPVEMCYANYKACPTPKRLFIAPGADHGLSYLQDPDGYQYAVLSFFGMCEELKNNTEQLDDTASL